MAKDEDPSKVPVIWTILTIISGVILGRAYRLTYIRYTSDTSNSLTVVSIPLFMLLFGLVILWLSRKPAFIRFWFPLAIVLICFGLSALLAQ